MLGVLSALSQTTMPVFCKEMWADLSALVTGGGSSPAKVIGVQKTSKASQSRMLRFNLVWIRVILA
jgi:hypothetical protein